MRTRLEIGALQALCAIADQGGVTRAAAYLALSQSAVSHKIKRLEEGLGCALLTRRAGTTPFTDEGERLLGYARRLLALHDEALLNLGQQPLTGRIRLGMTEDISGGGLARILGRFTRRHPEVSVQARVGQSLAIAARLARDELDIGILQVFAHQTLSTDLVLGRDALHWVRSPDLTLDLSRPVPFLSFDDSCFYRHWAMEAAQSQPPGLTTVLTCPSIAGILSALHAGLGVGLLHASQIPAGLEVIDAPFPAPPAIAHVVRVSQQARERAVGALVDEIAAELGRPALTRVA
ncbi:LysR family transcriptional regulator [Marichromatium gracile]|uniref:LysR family transcriptional regulator n=1 Tax=Marichromatium gracile TaxID=1048 RepID=UPI001F276B61|nr:LysR family transcriptional regulator [Marichromatium gracile]MCF1183803.1 LysR family transcriptional regulator [Marichromatium gracile]